MLSYFRKKKSTCRAWNTAAFRISKRTSHTKCAIRTLRRKFRTAISSTWKARAKQATSFWISTTFEYYIEGWQWSTLTKEIKITCLFITHRGKQDREGDAQLSKSELIRGCLSKNRPLDFAWKIVLPETLASERLYREYN